MEYDFKKTEAKWRSEWDNKEAFASEPDSTKKKFYITVAYPYPSGGMHVGHARTYTVPDIFARYKRMKGFNVLFPMAWHVTGTPIVGAVKRLKDGEEKQLKVLKETYGMTDAELSKIDTPMDYARYFIDNHYIPSMRSMGYCIDWRRQFTTNDAHYNKFITWQYESLHKKGLVREGKHPVRYCTSCKNPVTTHDLLEGESAEMQEWTLLKFPLVGSSDLLIAATLRPETMYGQTNMWVNPELSYVRTKVTTPGGKEESWIISRDCAEKLPFQDYSVEITGEIKGKELCGKVCEAPAIGREIPILPSSFPDPKVATGLVTSVPSDAPYDFIALKELKENPESLKDFGIEPETLNSIDVIPILSTKKFGACAAEKICSQMGINSLSQKDKLDIATKEVYKEGFHTGVMSKNSGPYGGKPVTVAKEMMREDFLKKGVAELINDFSEPVVCRCGAKVLVSNADSWFLRYSEPEWKILSKNCVDALNCIPETTRPEYYHTIDWLNDWPCIRNFGLGTKLPFDERFIIEPLSDSTVYMAFYTLSHILKDLPPESLKPELFDYVFNEVGDPKTIADSCGLSEETLKSLRESFSYWYPLDWRGTASELIGNHLTFMIFHHTALFHKAQWPKGIVCFGMGLLEGAKMSSSKGNVVLLKEAIDKFGADVVRLFLMSNAEPWQDFDWREKEVIGAQKALNKFYNLASEIILKKDAGSESAIDAWLLSRWQETKKEVGTALDSFQTRKALQTGFFEVFKLLNWYERRGGTNNKLRLEILDEWVRMIAPFTPYVSEEIWSMMGKKGFVLDAPYPVCDDSLIDKKAEAAEDIIESLLEDIAKIGEITKKAPSKISFYLPESWKYELFEKVSQGAQIPDLMKDDKFRVHGKQVVKLFRKAKELNFDSGWDVSDDKKVIESAVPFLKSELSCEIEIDPKEDPQEKRKFAVPKKAAIFIE